MIAFCVWGLIQPAWAGVRFRVELSRQVNGRWKPPIRTRLTFVTGTELRRQLNRPEIRPHESYAVVSSSKGIRYLELKSTILGMTSEFTREDFIRVFEVTGQIEAVEVGGNQRRWRIRAKYPSLPQNPWLDPTLNP